MHVSMHEQSLQSDSKTKAVVDLCSTFCQRVTCIFLVLRFFNVNRSDRLLTLHCCTRAERTRASLLIWLINFLRNGNEHLKSRQQLRRWFNSLQTGVCHVGRLLTETFSWLEPKKPIQYNVFQLLQLDMRAEAFSTRPCITHGY
jgi:hypothetical protein